MKISNKILVTIFALTTIVIGFGGNAFAVIPTIDGFLTVGTEWDAPLNTAAFDPNEGGIPDAYDMFRLLVKHEDTGGLSDGLYFRVDLFGTPTLTGGTNSFGAEAFVRTLIDFDGNALPDLGLDFNNAADSGLGLLGVYTNTATFSLASFIGYGGGSVLEAAGGFYEFYLPESLYNGNSVSTGIGYRLRLDNNGDEPDDSLPNTGFTTPVPEPQTLFLFASGLLGLMGLKKFRMV